MKSERDMRVKLGLRLGIGKTVDNLVGNKTAKAKLDLSFLKNCKRLGNKTYF